MRGQALIDHGRLFEALEAEVELLAGVVHDAALPVPVRMCPGWTVGEVLRHVGSVYRLVVAWLRGGQRPREWQREPRAGESVEHFFRSGFAELAGVLAAHDPGDPAPTWWPADRTYGFWYRRMAHETVVHRVDVQDAAGLTPTVVADDIAIDGIDEALALWFGHRLPLIGLTGTRDGQVAVRSGGHTWIARAGPTETVAWRCSEAEAERAGVTVTGRPHDVYLWLWGRNVPGSVTYDGADEDAAGQLWALMRLATR
ncbi:maleylpyruvate isomerase family mycothiol-dependent enzyme [Prauserella shujinwangii]|nr:maleylpyruvate isomerase family mycothiol-dependent enzyme [Prauserella shujinwangii]